MLYGTLAFSDSFQQPKHLDNASVDWVYPVPMKPKPYLYLDSRGIRNCYRSKRISLDRFYEAGATNVNATVFLQNTEALFPGAVRLCLWREWKDVDLVRGLTGSGWTQLSSVREYNHSSNASTPLVSTTNLVAGTTYRVDWEIEVAPNHGTIGITVGGAAVKAVDSTNTVTDRLYMSGSTRVTCTTSSPVVITPYEDPYNARMFNGNIKISVNTPYDIQPKIVGLEEYLDLFCKTRTVTKGVALGSTQVQGVFSAMQVVVMQPCTGVSVYLAPAQHNPGPVVGPGI